MRTFSGNPKFFLLLRFYSRAARRTFLTLALRDCPRWIIANVSCEQGDTSKMLSSASRFCICRMLLMNFLKAPQWEILQVNDKSPYLRRRETQGVCRERKKEEKKKEKVRRVQERGACYGDSSGLRCLRPSSRYRSPSVWYSAWTPARNSISKAALETTMAAGILTDGNISRITVGWGTLGISWRNTLSQTRFWRNNNRDVWGFKYPGGPFPTVSLLLGASSSFYVFLRGENWKRELNALTNLSYDCSLYNLYRGIACMLQPFDVTDDRCKEDCKNVKNTKYIFYWLKHLE